MTTRTTKMPATTTTGGQGALTKTGREKSKAGMTAKATIGSGTNWARTLK